MTSTFYQLDCHQLTLNDNQYPLHITNHRSSPRPISSSQLRMLPCFHPCPIHLVVHQGPYCITHGTSHLGGGFTLRCLQRLSPSELGYPAVPLVGQLVHQGFVHPGPLVLRTAPLRSPPPAPDRDRTVSRRSEPSSRTALMGEQPNPWDLLQPQDAMSRHRGAKPPRRCELLGVISLLSPG